MTLNRETQWTYDWRAKANKLIAQYSMTSYRAANFRTNGKPYKKHRPYTVPMVVDDLVACLNTDNEEACKAIFIRLAIIPESARD